MSNFNPNLTTVQNMAAVLNRDSEQRENQGGVKQLIGAELVHDGIPGSGTCKWGAMFSYSNNQVETLWGDKK